MPLTSFKQLMRDARAGGYAVGYFECWNLESLLAVADAAEKARSPVLLGFSGIYLPHPRRVRRDPLSLYAAMGLEVCNCLTVPACLVFNESSHLDWVMAAIDLDFGLVMFTDEAMARAEQIRHVGEVCKRAHGAGAAVEAELASVPGMAGDLHDAGASPGELRLTDPAEAAAFVFKTGVDALAVNVGQVHLHGRKHVHLDLDCVARLAEKIHVPLVLHGASSIDSSDLAQAIRLGIRKVNVGSVLKQAWLAALKAACIGVPADANPYEVVGSGFEVDTLQAARDAVAKAAYDFMLVFGSAGRA